MCWRTIPKGLRLPAQGCEARATLGHDSVMDTTPTGLRRILRHRRLNPARISRRPQREHEFLPLTLERLHVVFAEDAFQGFESGRVARRIGVEFVVDFTSSSANQLIATTAQPPHSFKNSCSLMTFTPSFCAFSSLEPASSPART